MASQLKGVLFDLDDTLIDWSGVWLSWREIESPRLARIAGHVNSSLHQDAVNVEALLDAYLERTRAAWREARVTLRAPYMPQILCAALGELGVDADRLEVAALLKVYGWDAIPGTVVFPDAPPLLKTLRSRGIKLGIVTNASQPMALRDVELATHGLIEHFPDCRLAAADAGYLKPHRRIFQTALARLGTSPEETVFIGDNPVADIAGAEAAGMRAILRITDRADFDAASGRTARARSNGNLPDIKHSLHSLEELPAMLDAWYPDWRDGKA